MATEYWRAQATDLKTENISLYKDLIDMKRLLSVYWILALGGWSCAAFILMLSVAL